METSRRLYEGMFLVDSALAAADWSRVEQTIRRILTKAEAEIVSLRKWDERRLAYPIGKVTRGTYILTYFRCDPLRVKDIERDVRLSEDLMRALILRTDKMRPEDMNKPTPLESAQLAQPEPSQPQAAADDLASDEEPQSVEQTV